MNSDTCFLHPFTLQTHVRAPHASQLIQDGLGQPVDVAQLHNQLAGSLQVSLVKGLCQVLQMLHGNNSVTLSCQPTQTVTCVNHTR